MGIVERSTGEDGLPSPLADACATEAMVTVRFSRPAELRELAVEGGVVAWWRRLRSQIFWSVLKLQE
jgi:hypothetical protein